MFQWVSAVTGFKDMLSGGINSPRVLSENKIKRVSFI
jgi:hypothetical protein